MNERYFPYENFVGARATCKLISWPRIIRSLRPFKRWQGDLRNLAISILFSCIASAIISAFIQVRSAAMVISADLEGFGERSSRFLTSNWMESAANFKLFGNIERALADQFNGFAHSAIIQDTNRTIGGFGPLAGVSVKFFEIGLGSYGNDLTITIPFYGHYNVIFFVTEQRWNGLFPFLNRVYTNGGELSLDINFWHWVLYVDKYFLVSFFILIVIALLALTLARYIKVRQEKQRLSKRVHDNRASIVSASMLAQIGSKAIEGNYNSKMLFQRLVATLYIQKCVDDLLQLDSPRASLVDINHLVRLAVDYCCISLNGNVEVNISSEKIVTYADEAALIKSLVNLLKNAVRECNRKNVQAAWLTVLSSPKWITFIVGNPGYIGNTDQICRIGYSSRGSSGLGMNIVIEAMKDLKAHVFLRQYTEVGCLNFSFSIKREPADALLPTKIYCSSNDPVILSFS